MVVYFRFKLRSTVSLLFLTYIISSIMSSFLSTSAAVLSACVMVFIFHVTFPIHLTTSPTLLVFLCILCIDETDQEIRCRLVLHLFALGNILLSISIREFGLLLCM